MRKLKHSTNRKPSFLRSAILLRVNRLFLPFRTGLLPIGRSLPCSLWLLVPTRSHIHFPINSSNPSNCSYFLFRYQGSWILSTFRCAFLGRLEFGWNQWCWRWINFSWQFHQFPIFHHGNAFHRDSRMQVSWRETESRVRSIWFRKMACQVKTWTQGIFFQGQCDFELIGHLCDVAGHQMSNPKELRRIRGVSLTC